MKDISRSKIENMEDTENISTTEDIDNTENINNNKTDKPIDLVYEICAFFANHPEKTDSDTLNYNKIIEERKYLCVYNSFNKFHRQLYYNNAPNAPSSNEDSARVKLRRLDNICDSLNINFQLFKNKNSEKKNTYFITYDVAALFSYLIDVIDEKYYRDKPYKKASEITLEDLLSLRSLYFSALESIKLEHSVIQNELQKFDQKTNCPPYEDYSPLGELSIRVLNHLEENYNVKISEHERYSLGKQLEYDFQYYFYPKFIDYCEKLFENHLKVNNISFQPSDENSIEVFLKSFPSKDLSE